MTGDRPTPFEVWKVRTKADSKPPKEVGIDWELRFAFLDNIWTAFETQWIAMGQVGRQDASNESRQAEVSMCMSLPRVIYLSGFSSAMIRQQNNGLALELGGHEFKPKLNKNSMELSLSMKSLTTRIPELLAKKDKELAKRREELELVSEAIIDNRTFRQ